MAANMAAKIGFFLKTGLNTILIAYYLYFFHWKVTVDDWVTQLVMYYDLTIHKIQNGRQNGRRK